MYLFQDLKKGIGSINFKNAQEARDWYASVAKSLMKSGSGPNSYVDNSEMAVAQRDWYLKNMQDMPIDSRKVVMNPEPFKIFQALSSGKDSPSSGGAIGKMYMFMYDAKHKDTLPYFDIFPLVFPIHFYNDGFLGINLHYLPPGERAALMNALYSTANNQKYNASMKLNISYSILKASSLKFSGFENCVKRYLTSHLRSSFHYVNPTDWDKALLLPLQRWHINPNRTYNPSGNPPW